MSSSRAERHQEGFTSPRAIAALLSPTVGRERSEQAVAQAIKTLQLKEQLTIAEALSVLDLLSRYEGMIGVTARFARSRADIANGAGHRPSVLVAGAARAAPPAEPVAGVARAAPPAEPVAGAARAASPAEPVAGAARAAPSLAPPVPAGDEPPPSVKRPPARSPLPSLAPPVPAGDEPPPSVKRLPARSPLPSLAPPAPAGDEPPPSVKRPPARGPLPTIAIEEIIGLLAQTIGWEKSDQSVRACAKRLALPESRLDKAQVTLLVEAMAAQSGIIGITARFAKARLILRFTR